MDNFRVDVYTARHKELRKMLFDMSVAISQSDFCNEANINLLTHDLKSSFHELREHARHENTYAHPILAPKLPSDRQYLEQEHEQHDQELAHLETLLLSLASKTEVDSKRQTVGLEFYRAFNRFIAHYLIHLDEEEYLMQNAWELCSHSELFAIMVAFKGIEDHKVLPNIMKLVDANLDASQKAEMFETIKSRLGTVIHDTIFKHLD